MTLENGILLSMFNLELSTQLSLIFCILANVGLCVNHHLLQTKASDESGQMYYTMSMTNCYVLV